MLNQVADIPSPQQRVIRVFVSSTFRDMQAEREELHEQIFPRLRELCESRGVTCGEVDPLWGITDEQKAEEVLPNRLEEIRRCRPYFIGLLGERYGWVPEEVPAAVIKHEPRLAELRRCSVTELEILHGVLNNPQMANHAYFYFRDPGYVQSLPLAQRADFEEGPTAEETRSFGAEEAERRAVERKQKLAMLKERIRTSGFPVREGYPDPRTLGDLVLADLTAVIDRLFPLRSHPDPLDRALILQARGDLDGATALLKEQERLCRELGNPEGLAFSLVVQAELLSSTLGRRLEARQLADEALAIARSYDPELVSRIQRIRDSIPADADEQSPDQLHHAIARRSFEFFEDRGSIMGRDLDHWLRAESEFLHPDRMNNSESNDALTVDAELPGFDAKELQASLEPRRLASGHDELQAEQVRRNKLGDLHSVAPVATPAELFRCSAFYPGSVGARTVGKIVAYIHLETVATEVVREAVRRLDLPSSTRTKAASAVPKVRLPRQSVVYITPDVLGLVFESAKASLSIWEDQQSVEFRFKPMTAFEGQLCRGWIHFWLEGLILADVAVAILVESEDVPDIFRKPLAEANARPYRLVFPSYSHDDAEVVERLEAYAESFGDEYLRDVRRLRTGQRWTDELRGFIRKANVFQLFWSDRAAHSSYVTDEWRYALQERDARRDPYFVRPVYWTDSPPPIPDELKPLHFAKVPLAGG